MTWVGTYLADNKKMTRVIVDSGICGRVTTIEVTKTDKWHVRLRINSDCGMVTKIGRTLVELDLRDALKSQVKSAVYKCASKFCSHASCPVPMAVLKAIEVEVRIALPKSVVVTFAAAE